ncbi:hypothetical protein BJA5080_07292 [Bradyrhizobium diazoefficiens SEMIA 5080]|uniref:Uncharacterized protein n=1 Tax=Bradyrhizobium diazoefficiens SEMIA 5080 TaxID=754504 RepID=A0A837C615_9BRAD|nr:hypothetical protein BJA5080_07292 [Bradyrhizobium diazoefficiens SEMIA 5080]
MAAAQTRSRRNSATSTCGTIHSGTRNRDIARSCQSMKISSDNWSYGGSARDPQSPVDAVAGSAVIGASLRLPHANSED